MATTNSHSTSALINPGSKPFKSIRVLIEYRVKSGFGVVPQDKRLLARCVEYHEGNRHMGSDMLSNSACIYPGKALERVINLLGKVTNEIQVEYDPLLNRPVEIISCGGAT